MSATAEREIEQHPTSRLLKYLQWLLPLGLFAVAAAYESLEHIIIVRTPPPFFTFTTEVIFFGVIGPACVAIVLGYVRRILARQMEAQHYIQEVNRNLERTIAERTHHLEEARSDLQEKNKVLDLAITELRQLDQVKSDFVALVSHSFRAPLTNMNGALELIAQDSAILPERVRDTVSILSKEGVRLERLVRTILDVSRLDSGNLKLNPGPLALEPLLSHLVHAVNSTQPRCRVILETPSRMPPAWADEVYVEEVLHNLMSNAEKYAPEGSRVHLAAFLAGDEIAVSVTDHGPGVPPGEQSKIFRAFHRSEVGKREDTSGLGLGLYFASKLVQAQGGRIWVESPVWPDANGPGTRFVFTLPVATEVPDMEEASHDQGANSGR